MPRKKKKTKEKALKGSFKKGGPLRLGVLDSYGRRERGENPRREKFPPPDVLWKAVVHKRGPEYRE